jgi:tungstate transport system substrate-binding protein
MDAALDAARTANAYVLSDRGSWIAFKDRGDLDIVVEGDKRLLNQYGAMLVNPEKFPDVKKELGQTFVDWLISPEGQAAIAGYKVDGQQLFFPNAAKSGG